MSVVINTTVVSNFASVGRLELLSILWQVIYLPDQVYAEIQSGITYGYAFYDDIDHFVYPFDECGLFYLTALHSPEEFRLFGELLKTLDEGEAACLSLAHHREWGFLSDDRAARRAAKRLNVPVTGTLGILLSLLKRERMTLSEADVMLAQMIQNGYYAPVTSLAKLL